MPCAQKAAALCLQPFVFPFKVVSCSLNGCYITHLAFDMPLNSSQEMVSMEARPKSLLSFISQHCSGFDLKHA